MVASGKAALEQAARDLLLPSKKIEGHFERLLRRMLSPVSNRPDLVARMGFGCRP